MKLRMNAAMRPFYRKMPRTLPQRQVPTLRKIGGAIIERHGGLFFKKFYPTSKKKVEPDRSASHDLTGFECFINKVHLEDLIAGNVLELLKGAVLLGNEILNRPPRAHGKIRVIVGLQEDLRVCTLRFHVVRPNEVWLVDNLEEYEDAVLVIESGQPRPR